MKIISQLGIGLFLISPFAALAQQGEAVKPIAAAEARKMIGTNAVVLGKIAEVHKTEKVIRLNFGEKYPRQVFTAAVFAKDFNTFTNLDVLPGKTVEIPGKVTEYRGRPEMILNTKDQLRVASATPTG